MLRIYVNILHGRSRSKGKRPENQSVSMPPKRKKFIPSILPMFANHLNGHQQCDKEQNPGSHRCNSTSYYPWI